jgi:photosystem II stability/assembly factor-like uncharacterized protein
MRSIGAAFRSCLVVSTAVATLASTGCHGEDNWEPLTEQKIYVSDKFFDVAVHDAKHAMIIGYGGKIIETANGGMSWSQIDAGTRKSLYSIDFAPGHQVGWIVGEEGLILRTTDGGKTWKPQEAVVWLDDACKDPEERAYRQIDSPCQYAYLFAISAVDERNAYAVGDKSIYTRTRDGGETWEVRTLKFETEAASDLALAYEDPVLYDIEFLDADHGYIVGEFGKIYYTEDGGQTWSQQQESVMDESVLDILDLPTFFDIEFSGTKSAIVAGLDGRIAETADGGKDWNFVPSNVDEFIDPFYSAALMGDGTRWVVGASGQVVKAPPGAEFARGSLGSQINNWMRRIRFYDDKYGWIVGGFGLVMSTDDGGKTWYRRIG